MLTVIHVPSMHLKHPVKCICSEWSRVGLACPHCIRDYQVVYSRSLSEQVVSHSPVAIRTSFSSSGACNLNHLVCRIQLNVVVFSSDGLHHILHSGIQSIITVLFLHSLILSCLRCTHTQPHRLIPSVIEWMESRLWSDLKFQSNSCIHHNSLAHAIVCLVPMILNNHCETLWTVWQPAIAW